jgi:hypothetical protein
VSIFFDGQVLEDPSNKEVVDSYLGPNATRLEGREFDLVIVGAGPGGSTSWNESTPQGAEYLSKWGLQGNARGARRLAYREHIRLPPHRR